MSIKESLKNLKLPTPTLAVTDIGVLAIAPKLIEEYKMVFAGVELGMNLDDFWDFGVTPRPIDKKGSEKEDHEPFNYYLTFLQSLRKITKLIEENKNEIDQQRQKNNLAWFVSTINHLEGDTISKEENHWNPDNVKKYRESVALVWAMFLASMTPNSDLSLHDIANQEKHFSLEACYKWIDDNNQDESHGLEKIYTRRMFYGALVFQVISDHGKKHFAKEQFIPSFGGIGFENYNEEELKEYVEKTAKEYIVLAVKAGVEPNVLKLFANLFPKIQRFLKKLKKDKKACEWAYS